VKAEEKAKGKAHMTLAMRINILSVYLHHRFMAEHAFNHRRYFRRRARLEL
jgi:hypothetical protein